MYMTNNLSHLKNREYENKLTFLFLIGDENYIDQEKNNKAVFSEMKRIKDNGLVIEGTQVHVNW